MLDTVLAMERLGFAFNDGERAVQGRLSSSEIGPEAVRGRLRLILAGKEGTRDELSRFIERKFALFEREIEKGKNYAAVLTAHAWFQKSSLRLFSVFSPLRCGSAKGTSASSCEARTARSWNSNPRDDL